MSSSPSSQHIQKELAALRRMFTDAAQKRKPDGWARDIPRKGELAVLEGGPSDGCWWWRAQLERHQQACWNAHRDWRTTAPNPICGYQPTGQWAAHACEIHPDSRAPVQGRVWSWESPAGSAVAS
jgi:hypothetical protein